LVGVLVDFFIVRCQTNRPNSFRKNHWCVQCYDGDIIGLIKIRNDNFKKYFPFCCCNLHNWRRCIGYEGRLCWFSSSFGRPLDLLSLQPIWSRPTSHIKRIFIYKEKALYFNEITMGMWQFYLYFSKQLAAKRTFESEIKVPLQK
jgi:hypothetical protein